MKSILILAAVLTITGCATKHYGRQGTVTSYESTTLTCREIDLEIAKVNGFIAQVDAEHSKIDGRSVLAFLGDFGLGNSIEMLAAKESAEKRMAALQALRQTKACTTA